MATITKIKGADRPFAHMVFFELTDTAPDLLEHFVHLCVKYLGGHPGQQHFSVGVRALEINRDVSATAFEVSMHMIFDNIATYRDYSKDPKHEKFITKSAGMSTTRIVYDSYLEDSIDRNVKTKANKKATQKKGTKA